MSSAASPRSRAARGRLHVASALAALALALAPLAARADDGAWSEWEPPSATNAFQSAFFDPARLELVVLPGIGASNGSEYWTLSLSAAPHWMRHDTGLPSPGARTGGFVVYDSARDRLLLVGGVGSPALPGQADEVWALSLASGTWSQLALAATRAINGAAGIYDPVGDCIVAFHNWWDGNTAEVWTLPLAPGSGWARLDAAGTAGTSSNHTAIYDPVRHRMLVYGGTLSSASASDPIAVDLGNPPLLHPLGASGTPPPELSKPCAVYDPIGDRMLVWGGSTTSSAVWELSLSGTPTWNTVIAASSSDPARVTSGVGFDPAHDQMVIFGGVGPGGLSNESWGLDLSLFPLWVPFTGVTGTEPAGRDGASALADPLRDRMLVFGGLTATGASNFQLWSHAWSAGAPWQLVPTSGPAPGATEPIAYDPRRDRLLGFGTNVVVALPLAGSGTLHWASLAPSGTAPSTRKGVATACDPAGDRFFIFGGRLISGTLTNTYLDDLWMVNLSGTPAWSKLTPVGAHPTARWNARFVRDAKRGRLLLVGGTNGADSLRDVWDLGLGDSPQWTELLPGAPGLPSPTAASTDTVGDRLLALSGTQLWELPLGAAPAWRALAPSGIGPPPVTGAGLAYDPARSEAVLYGGLRPDGVLRVSELWSVMFPPPAAAVPTGGGGDLGLSAWPNPSRDHLDVSFTLARAGRVRLELADIAGRRVREIDAGELAAGSHALRLEAGAALSAGLYFATLRTSDGTRRAKVVIAR